MCDEQRRIFKLANRGDVKALRELGLTVDGARLIRESSVAGTGDTLIHVAARNGNYELLSMLTELQLFNVNAANLEGKRPLHDAAQFGHAACVRHLVAAGAEVDALKRADWTPLMLACTQDIVEVVDELLQNGANPGLRNKDGWNCFHIACREGHLRIMRCILDADREVWKTHSNNGRTPLHTVALHGRMAALNLLLTSCSYDLNCRDSCGCTPFMDAVRSGQMDVLVAMAQLPQLDVAACDLMGRQAIHAAAESGHIAAVQLLVNRYGVDINVVAQSTRSTCLHFAAKEGHHDVIASLIDLGAQIDAADCRGRTALHIASACQHAVCVRVLLGAGARDQPDLAGLKAQDMAKKSDVVLAFCKLD